MPPTSDTKRASTEFQARFNFVQNCYPQHLCSANKLPTHTRRVVRSFFCSARQWSVKKCRRSSWRKKIISQTTEARHQRPLAPTLSCTQVRMLCRDTHTHSCDTRHCKAAMRSRYFSNVERAAFNWCVSKRRAGSRECEQNVLFPFI